MGYGGMGGMGMMGMMGMGGGGYGGYGGYGYGGYGAPPTMGSTVQSLNQGNAPVAGTTPFDQTGQYLSGGAGTGMNMQRIPHIIPNPFDNTLLVQATPTEWEQIHRLLAQLDVPPRQVLIEAKIYSVDLSGALAGGVDAFLQNTQGGSGPISTAPDGTQRLAVASNAFSAGTSAIMTTGLLVGHSRELLAVVQAQETRSKAKVIQAPSIIATDSIPASINVGTDVPTLTSQGVAAGAQSNGSSLFTNTIGNRSTGVSLSITPYVNSSGVVTMMINQNVSSPSQTTTSNIQSPSFATKTVQTQVTVQDGDTIAIAGIINETESNTSSGLPFLSRLPVVGFAFGQKSVSKTRSELIIFITPRVIYDSNQLADASDELKAKVVGLRKLMKEQ
jgi:general secretion pathway protein D